jgi:hypothetical protein
MPPTGERLSAAQVAILRAWIDQGASWGTPVATADPKKTHWAFQPVVRPALPKTTGGRVHNPIDQFILARLDKERLSGSPEADRRTLLRRLKFDLLGLPPTPEEIEEFVKDRRPDAYERLVDRLLASPHFGERWARHWLDVVRFAESDGFETNLHRPNAWPYRDYVIAAFNADKPYDRFVQEQLTGDALGADEAAGFLVGGPCDKVKSPDVVLTRQQRADELHDMVSTTGSAFLGLTAAAPAVITTSSTPSRRRITTASVPSSPASSTASGRWPATPTEKRARRTCVGLSPRWTAKSTRPNRLPSPPVPPAGDRPLTR